LVGLVGFRQDFDRIGRIGEILVGLVGLVGWIGSLDTQILDILIKSGECQKTGGGGGQPTDPRTINPLRALLPGKVRLRIYIYIYIFRVLPQRTSDQVVPLVP
jgi:hypothetical protein